MKISTQLLVSGAALAALGLGTVSCDATSGPSARCVDWDTKKTKASVTPAPARTYNRTKKRWENGSTPKPYATVIKTRYCDEWETETPSPTPTNS